MNDTEARKAKAKELSAKGYSFREIARLLKISRTTARNWIQGREKKKKNPPTMLNMTTEIEEMRQAAERINQIEFDDYEEPVEQIWNRAEREATRTINKIRAYSQFRWRAPGEHVFIAFISDQHIAHGTPVDLKAMREDAEIIRSTPNCYAILGGDGIDNHIKHRAAILAARCQPQDQYKLYDYYLQLLGDRVILMISGNHENWTSQHAGIDIVGNIAKDRRICYAPDVAYLDISVGTQDYTIAVRHQYRLNSSFNQTHSVKQWLRLGDREFDIGCIGHNHEHALESFVYRNKICWGCRPGSYQITSAYSRQHGFNNCVPTTPTFLLNGSKREIYGWPSIRSMLEANKAIKTLGIS